MSAAPEAKNPATDWVNEGDLMKLTLAPTPRRCLHVQPVDRDEDWPAVCTRPRDHAANHAVHDINGRVLTTWSDEAMAEARYQARLAGERAAARAHLDVLVGGLRKFVGLPLGGAS